MDLRQGKIFRLNAIGATVVELLANGSTEALVASEISKRCGVEIALVSADIHTFLDALKRYDLVNEDRNFNPGESR